MLRIHRYIVPCALAALMSLLTPIESHASDGNENRKTDSLSLGDLTKFGDWAANSSRYSLDMLGITDMECECTFIVDKEERQWLFQAEPEIKGIDRDGPSHGVLKDGDVIVAIDGMLITTRKAGIRFANLVAGEPVDITVRRKGRTRSVAVVPRVAPLPDVPIEPTVPGVTALPDLARSIEALSRRAADLGRMVDAIELPEAPEMPSFPEFNIDFTNMLPEGWIGFGLSFGGSIQQKDAGKPAEWRFDEPPSIKSIQPGSPADEAGLQVNDVLLEIDGLKLDSRKGGQRFSHMEPGQAVEWKVRRGGKTFTVETTARERPRDKHVEVPPEPLDPDASQPIRYTGTLGGTEIEVRGGKNVRVEVDEQTGETVIRTGDSVVRLKAKDKR